MVATANTQVVAQVAFFDAVCAFVAFLAESALFFAVKAEVIVTFAAFTRSVKRLEFREERLFFLPNLDDGGGDVCGGQRLGTFCTLPLRVTMNLVGGFRT